MGGPIEDVVGDEPGDRIADRRFFLCFLDQIPQKRSAPAQVHGAAEAADPIILHPGPESVEKEEIGSLTAEVKHFLSPGGGIPLFPGRVSPKIMWVHA